MVYYCVIYRAKIISCVVVVKGKVCSSGNARSLKECLIEIMVNMLKIERVSKSRNFLIVLSIIFSLEVMFKEKFLRSWT